MPIWILVSDASRAVLYATEERGGDWSLVGSYQHPESRLKNSQLTPSEPGHSAKSKGSARHTVLEPDTAPKQAEFEHFAEQLSDALTVGVGQNRFEALVLVAPPHFLGLLRNQLSTEVEKHLIAALDKDYTALPPGELRERLEDAILGGRRIFNLPVPAGKLARNLVAFQSLQATLGRGQVRVDAERRTILGDGRLCFAAPDKRLSQVTMCRGIVGQSLHD